MKISINDTLHDFGIYKNQISDLFIWHFDDNKEAAAYFGVTPRTIDNWKARGNYPLAVIRLLLVIHRGYLPTSKEWSGFKIRGDRLYTPAGREISAYDLMELDIKIAYGENVVQFSRKKKTWVKKRHVKKQGNKCPVNA